MSVPMRVHASTHEGLVHDTNEDSYATLETVEGGLLLVVCDGMGGMGHGEEASQLAVQVLSRSLLEGAGLPADRLKEAIRLADIEVRDVLCDDGRGMPGSTAVLLYVVDGLGHVAWVGDSRAYLIRKGSVVERTTDHKLVSELVAAGQLSEAEARASTLAHVVTRALGGRPRREPPVAGSTLPQPWRFRPGDAVVLCSDGICDLVEDHEIGPLVGDRDPAEAARALVQAALERGGHDNITCIVGRWGQSAAEDGVPAPLVQVPATHTSGRSSGGPGSSGSAAGGSRPAPGDHAPGGWGSRSSSGGSTSGGDPPWSWLTIGVGAGLLIALAALALGLFGSGT